MPNLTFAYGSDLHSPSRAEKLGTLEVMPWAMCFDEPMIQLEPNR